jgi:hypothetical protein
MLLVTLLTFAAQEVAPATAKSQFYGVHYLSGRLLQRDVGKMDRGGVGVVRRLLLWARVEPRKGKFRWGETDRVVGDLASSGIRLLPFVYGSPGYVAHDLAVPPVGSARKLKLWREFLRAAVNRYGPGGDYWTSPGLYPLQHPGKPDVPITEWQIWNEPNLDKFFLPHASVGRYVRLVRNSHRAIEGADPPAEIMLAGLSGRGHPAPAKFLDRFYRAHRIKRSFDSVAINPYAPSISQVGAKIRNLRQVMRKHRDGKTAASITELGWGSGPPDRFGLNKGLRGQKRMLTRSFRLIRRHRGAWHLTSLIWFDFRDPLPSVGGCSFCNTAGLLRHAGKPKPAWRAYKRFTGAAR